MDIAEIIFCLKELPSGDWLHTNCGRALYCHELGASRQTYSSEYGSETVVDILDPYGHPPIGREKEEFSIKRNGNRFYLLRELHRSTPTTKRTIFGSVAELEFKDGSKGMNHYFNLRLLVNEELVAQSLENSLPSLDDFFGFLNQRPSGLSSSVYNALRNL